MYLKLMVRGLLRYRKRGRRLFALMALCACALIFLLTFRADFSLQNRDQFIGFQTGHLQVVPAGSVLLEQSFTISERGNIPLLNLGADFDSWLHEQGEIEEAAPTISRFCMSYNLDSENESWISLIALPSARQGKLFPTAVVVDGAEMPAWNPGMPDVPMLRARLASEWGERNRPTDRFVETELKRTKDEMPEFMARLASDFPSFMTGGPYADTVRDFPRFMEDWKKAIADPRLYGKIPARFTGEYDWKIDDALAAARDNADPEKAGFLNKRIFAALYPDDIVNPKEPIVPGKRVSLQIAPFTTRYATDLPVVIPAVYAGMCDVNPLYTPNSFIDIDAFRHYLGLGPDSATAWVVRLKDIRDTGRVKAKIEAKLADMGSDAKVIDWNYLGKIYLATGMAFDVVISILVAIFVVILLIFTVNLVLMSMIQRRKEIGTGLALGLGNMQSIVIMTGEVGVIVAVSTLAGSILGLAAVLAAGRFGIPGMIFFSGGHLKLTLQAMPFILTWAILLPSSVIVAFIPLMRMNRLLPVELFREAR